MLSACNMLAIRVQKVAHILSLAERLLTLRP